MTIAQIDESNLSEQQKEVARIAFEEAQKSNLVNEIENFEELFVGLVGAESSFGVSNVSPTGPKGPFQFARATAIEQGLKVDGDVDERFDPRLSARAAVNYLETLHNQFGNAEDAFTAYNFGPGALSQSKAGTRQVTEEAQQYFGRVAASRDNVFNSNSQGNNDNIAQNVVDAVIPSAQAADAPQDQTSTQALDAEENAVADADIASQGNSINLLQGDLNKLGDAGIFDSISNDSGMFIEGINRIAQRRLNNAQTDDERQQVISEGREFVSLLRENNITTFTQYQSFITQQAQTQPTDQDETGIVDQVIAAPGRIGSGFNRALGGIIEGIGTISQSVSDAIGGFTGDLVIGENGLEYIPPDEVRQQAAIGERRNFLNIAGEAIADINVGDPETRTERVLEGIGALGTFVFGGAAGQALRGATGATAAATGLGVSAGVDQQVNDYVETIQETGAPFDQNTKDAAIALGGIIGASEAIPALGALGRAFGGVTPVGKVFEAIDRTTGGAITNALKKGVAGAGEEGVQELLAEVGRNLVASDVLEYDTEREAFNDAAIQGGEDGAIVGFIFNSFLGALEPGRRRRVQDSLNEAAGQTQSDTDGVQPNQPGASRPVGDRPAPQAPTQVAQSNRDNPEIQRNLGLVPPTVNNRFAQAATPIEQLNEINESLARAAEFVDTTPADREFISSADRNNLRGIAGSDSVFISTSGRTTFTKLISDAIGGNKRINRKTVNTSPDQTKPLQIRLNSEFVNGDQSNRGTFFINKISPRAIESVTVDATGFDQIRGDETLNEFFDVDNVSVVNGTFVLEPRQTQASTSLLNETHIEPLEQIRQQIELGIDIDPSFESSLTFRQRVTLGVPPLPDAGLLERTAFRTTRALRSSGALPRQLSEKLRLSRTRGLANAERINQLNENLARNIAKINNERTFRLDVNRLDKFIQTEYVNLALHGDSAALAGLDDRSQKLVGDIRAELDALSTSMIESGQLDQKLADTLKDNLGEYLLRSYKVFRPEENWNYTTVINDNRPIYDAAFKEISGVIKGKDRNISEANLATETDNVIREMLSESRADGLLYGATRAGRVDIRSFIRRQDLSPAIRALLGEDTNPFIQVAQTAKRQSTIVAAYAAQKEVAAIGLELGLWSTEKNARANHIGRIFDGGKDEFGRDTTKKQFAAFDGLYADPILAEEMTKLYDSFSSDKGLTESIGNWMAGITAIGKFNQVILSQQAYPTNALGAGWMEVLNGRLILTNKGVTSSLNQLNPRAIARRLKRNDEIIPLNEDIQELYNSRAKDSGDIKLKPFTESTLIYLLQSEGLLNQSVFGADVTETARTANETLGRLVAPLSAGYQVPDNMGKINAMIVEMDTLMRAHPDAKMGDIITRAADKVRRTTQNYDLVPKIIKYFSQRGLFVPTYVSFSAEMVRTSANTARLAYEEIRSDNPVIKRAGWRRIAGIGLVSFGLAALKATQGGEEDERNAWLEEFKPPYLDGKDAHILSVKDGQIRWYDPTYLLPYQMHLNVLQRAFTNPDDNEDVTFAHALASLWENFGGVNIASQVVFDIVRNQKENGAKVWNTDEEEAYPGSKYPKIVEHVAESMFYPGFLRSINAINETQSGEIGFMGSFRDEQDIAGSLIGLRTFSTDIDTAYTQKLDGLIREYNRVNRIVANKKPDRLTDEQFSRRTDVERIRTQQVEADIRRFVQNMKILGISSARINRDSKGAPKELRNIIKSESF